MSQMRMGNSVGDLLTTGQAEADEATGGLIVFAGGLLLGTVVVGRLIPGIVDRKAKKEKKQARNIFSWRVLAKNKERYSQR